MSKTTYVKPRSNIKLRSGPQTCLRSSHQNKSLRINSQKSQRPVSPDEAQTEAVGLDPTYVFPDGSINFWAGLTAEPVKPKTEEEPEDK